LLIWLCLLILLRRCGLILLRLLILLCWHGLILLRLLVLLLLRRHCLVLLSLWDGRGRVCGCGGWRICLVGGILLVLLRHNRHAA
jgi:hypothetical protein